METKKVYWMHNGIKYYGTATYDETYIEIVSDETQDTIDFCEQEYCDKGITLDMVWEDMPEDITNWYMV